MLELDEVAPNYQRARQHWPDAPLLSEYYEALCVCYATNRLGLLEHTKSYIECVCHTILEEFGAEKPSNLDNAGVLLEFALRPLGMGHSRSGSKLDQLISAFARIFNIVGEMRNENGAIAHGKDAYLDAVAADHAKAFLHTGDAILAVLLNALEGKEPRLEHTREPYSRFPHHHALIDQAVAVTAHVDQDDTPNVIIVSIATGSLDDAIEIRIEPSRLLYGVDRSIYVEVLAAAKTLKIEPLAVEDGVTISEQADIYVSPPSHEELTTPDPSTVESPPSQVMSDAFLRDLTSGLTSDIDIDKLRESFLTILESNEVSNANLTIDITELVNALLVASVENMGLDWQVREVLQARLRIALRRTLSSSGVPSGKAHDITPQLVESLLIVSS